MTPLQAREGYRLWAPTYEEETAVSFLENDVVGNLRVPAEGVLLDAGCGTARRLREAKHAQVAVGADASMAMLGRAAREQVMRAPLLAAADLRALPFAAASFDVVWCRLAIGHVRELDRVYSELSRVCRTGGWLVVTDFHPDAVAAGHQRTFRDANGVVHEIEHHAHPVEHHLECAIAHRLRLRAHRDGAVGPRVRGFYKAARRLDAYDRQRGLRLVLAFAFQRDAGA
ncbi:MAG TPA: class I SAM-dependent methyltransferase [Gemmatimonadaceae bacterium]